ncbi:efflux transporter outer membrane subunit [Novosphingobium album (ex Liu et al. 2023)]|uniref:Efflux transporter outer membrane subunit n=1 Tax=Novosphingobium album (ex Liu et al. 2023) TaxID=3031130 RepID=A0ABT5WS31_9SPHN|nr:efflux transporter outer membrane subunit [Novosphingobium album (ex Liu et al. 2023)]MDE8652833.1 efflux transporter outer membrane subunit [Novosphingobium album (ex Liu et al. 2023)]
MVRRIVLPIMLLALGGCAVVGPDYRLPKDAAVAAPDAQGSFLSAGSHVRNDPLPDHWWRLYNDPVLDGLVEEALAANTDLRVAEANLERSLALLDARGASREPQASFNAETSYAQRSAEAELQHVKPPVRQIYNGGVSASYDLDLFGGLRRGIEAASADMEAAVAARDLVRVNVAAETARAYADICNAGYQLDILGRQVSLQEKGASLTDVLVRNGRAVPYERDRRQAVLDATKARLPRVAARQRGALFRLAALLGRTPRQADFSLLACRHPLILGDPVPVGDGQALLKRRPDIRMAERRLAAATARIGVATAALYPDIHFGATLGSTGAAADFLSPLTNRFGLGPLISWSLNRHAARAQIAAAEAQGRAELASFDGMVLKALREAETALNSYAGGLEQQESLDRARDEAARVARHTRQLRRGGKIAELPALDAERDLLLAEQAAMEGQAMINEDQIALFLALGGGWSAGPDVPGKTDVR